MAKPFSMPKPRKLLAEVRLALSKEALNMKGIFNRRGYFF